MERNFFRRINGNGFVSNYDAKILTRLKDINTVSKRSEAVSFLQRKIVQSRGK